MRALLIASGSVSPKQATSPVDRISTPTVGSAPSICMNENCGAFTANPFGSGASSRPVSFPPSRTGATSSMRFIPVAFETKGIDLEALRLHSMTWTSSPTTRYWMLNGPLAPSSRAMALAVVPHLLLGHRRSR